MIFSILSLLSFLILLFLGFNLTVFNGKRGINRVLAVFCYGGAFIGLGELLIYFSPTLDHAIFLAYFVTPWPIFQAAFLHFILIFTRNPLGRSKLFLCAYYIVAVSMAAMFLRYVHMEKPVEYFQGFFLESPITIEVQYSIVVMWVTVVQAVSFVMVIVFTLTRPRGTDIRRQGIWLTASMASIFGFAVILHTLRLSLFPTIPEMTGTQYLLFGIIFYLGVRKGNLLDLLPHQVADRILRTMDEAVIITDSDFKVLRINDSARVRFPSLEKHGGNINLKDAIRNISSEGDGYFLCNDEDFVRRNLRIIDREGKVRWYSFTRTRVRKWAKSRYFVFTGSDITDLKENIDEREVLLAEIHHRVGNNLQLVLSLIDMKLCQSEEENPLEVILALKDFIYAMSSVHRVLYDTDKLNAVPLEEYLRDVYTDFARNHPVTLPMDASFELKGYSLDISTSLLVALFFIETLRVILGHIKNVEGKGSLEIMISREGSSLVISFTPSGFEKTEKPSLQEGLSGILLNALGGSIMYPPAADSGNGRIRILLNPPM